MRIDARIGEKAGDEAASVRACRLMQRRRAASPLHGIATDEGREGCVVVISNPRFPYSAPKIDRTSFTSSPGCARKALSTATKPQPAARCRAVSFACRAIERREELTADRGRTPHTPPASKQREGAQNTPALALNDCGPSPFVPFADLTPAHLECSCKLPPHHTTVPNSRTLPW